MKTGILLQLKGSEAETKATMLFKSGSTTTSALNAATAVLVLLWACTGQFKWQLKDLLPLTKINVNKLKCIFIYSLVQSNDHHLTEKQVEESFGSNLCRCTGYRPILEAFKSFAVDPDPKIIHKIKDIEDVDNLLCPKSGKKCGGICESTSDYSNWCVVDAKATSSHVAFPKKILLSDGRFWYAVNTIKSIFESLDQSNGYDNYMLICGHTSRGKKMHYLYLN